MDEFKTIMRKHTPGNPYLAPDDILNAEALDGWQLISAVAVGGGSFNYVYEVLYLGRKKTGPAPT